MRRMIWPLLLAVLLGGQGCIAVRYTTIKEYVPKDVIRPQVTLMGPAPVTAAEALVSVITEPVAAIAAIGTEGFRTVNVVTGNRIARKITDRRIAFGKDAGERVMRPATITQANTIVAGQQALVVQ